MFSKTLLVAAVLLLCVSGLPLEFKNRGTPENSIQNPDAEDGEAGLMPDNGVRQDEEDRTQQRGTTFDGDDLSGEADQKERKEEENSLLQTNPTSTVVIEPFPTEGSDTDQQSFVEVSAQEPKKPPTDPSSTVVIEPFPTEDTDTDQQSFVEKKIKGGTKKFESYHKATHKVARHEEAYPVTYDNTEAANEGLHLKGSEDEKTGPYYSFLENHPKEAAKEKSKEKKEHEEKTEKKDPAKSIIYDNSEAANEGVPQDPSGDEKTGPYFSFASTKCDATSCHSCAQDAGCAWLTDSQVPLNKRCVKVHEMHKCDKEHETFTQVCGCEAEVGTGACDQSKTFEASLLEAAFSVSNRRKCMEQAK